MKIFTSLSQRLGVLCILFLCLQSEISYSQTLSFQGAEGFGRYAAGARASTAKEVYIVTNLNDSGAGSFRDAVSKSGRIVVFAVGGIIKLSSDVSVAANITIAGQTAPGDGIVISNKRVTFTSANNTICRFLRLRLGATGNSGKDVSGLASGANMIFDHMSFAWAMDEVFSINWDGKGTSPDNITIQNSIIGQGLHRENHSAGGLIQTPDGGKVSLIKNLYISNKTRNPKVKGVNEFVNNVVYNWGNGDRLGDTFNYGWTGDAYIMGGSSGVSEVNIINNYFVGGPLTPPNKNSPFSRGTGTFNIYGSGNYFDNNKNGILDGTEVPYDGSAYGYPGITEEAFKTQAYAYPMANPTLTAEQAYQYIIDNVGATYPHRDELDAFMIDEVASKGIKGFYVYRETDLPLSNGGLGNVFGAPAPLDSDKDGMPDAWEDAHGLNKNNKDDAVAMSNSHTGYLNIEVYINELATSPPTSFLRPPSSLLAKTITPTSISLEWKDNSETESNFILERSLDNTLFNVVDTLKANSISFTDSNLESNKTYYYRIRGVNATENSIYATLTTKTLTAPSAPSVPTSSIPLNNALGVEAINQNLNWVGSSNTLSYKIYFGTDSSQLEYKGEQTSTVYPVTGLQENTFYYWRIDAINNLGLTTGDIWSFKTLKNYPIGIIGDWRFDENFGTVAADSSIYRNDAEINDVPDYEWETGKINNGINLKTMTSAAGILIPHEDHLLLDKGSFSISLWVKAPAQSAVSKYIFHKGTFAKNIEAKTTGKWFGLELKDGSLHFSVDDDVTKSSATISNSTFFNNTWNHIVLIRDVSSKKLRIYRNGFKVVESTDNTNGGIGGDEPLVIANTNSFNAPFAGNLDEFKVFNYPLPENEILNLYHTSPLPLPAYSQNPENNSNTSASHLVNVSWKGGINTTSYKLYFGDSIVNLTYKAEVLLENPFYQFVGLEQNTSYYWRVDAVGPAGITEGEIWSFKTPFRQGIMADWKLDATTGTEIRDQTIYENHGELRNISDYAWEEGRVNNGLNLKTVITNSAIRIPSKENIVFDKNSFSISLWVKANKPAVASTSAYLLFKGSFAKNVATGATGKWYGVELKNNNISLNVDDDVVKSSVTISNNTFLNNAWINIVFVRDVVAKKLRIYRNGVLAVEGNDITSILNGIGSIEPLYIANSNDLNTPFKGMLDEIKMFNYVLTPAEIAGLASAKDAQNIYFPTLETKKTIDEDFNGDAVSSSGLNVTYTSSNPDVATIIDGKIHLVGAGTSTITAIQEGDVNYLAAIPVSQILSVTKAEQTITFNSLNPVRIGDANIQLDAISSSGLAVSFVSSNENVAKIIDGSLKILNHGSTIITAVQDGNEIYQSTSTSRELIVKPFHLQVLYQDGDNGKKINNTIKPFLKIANQDSIAISYKELTLRYWITAENFAGINTWIDYAQMGNNKVSMKYVSLSQPLKDALGYIEYSFTDQSLSLDPGKNSGVIQSRLSNKDYGLFSESDDYSYQEGNAYSINNNITMYRNGSLIWGTEPETVDSILKVKVLYANKNNNSASNSINTTLTISNDGNFPISYEDLSVRYWFTSEGQSSLNYWIDYAKLGSNKFNAQFVQLNPTFIGADTYFELKPKSELGLFYPLSNTGVIDYRIAKSNWSVFNESDDYSYLHKAALAENNHITIYYKNQLIYGVEPIEIFNTHNSISEKHLSSVNNISNGISKEDGVITYPNPSRGVFKVEVNTEENGNINISVFNSVGELVQSVKDIKNGIYEKEINLINLVPGTYYINVKINGFVKTKAIIVY